MLLSELLYDGEYLRASRFRLPEGHAYRRYALYKRGGGKGCVCVYMRESPCSVPNGICDSKKRPFMPFVYALPFLLKCGREDENFCGYGNKRENLNLFFSQRDLSECWKENGIHRNSQKLYRQRQVLFRQRG